MRILAVYTIMSLDGVVQSPGGPDEDPTGFGEGTIPAALKLVESKVSTTGVMLNTYARAGDITPGSFEFDQPTEAEIERRKSLVDA
jgi:hypothetical protein